MAQTYKVLGQVAPGTANTETVLYTAPTATQVAVSTISVANLTGTAATARINVRPSGAAVTNAHAFVRDVSVAANGLLAFTVGISLGAGDVISVQAGTAGALAFHAYGMEVTA